MLRAGAWRGNAGAPAAGLVIAVLKPPEACGAHCAVCAAENVTDAAYTRGQVASQGCAGLDLPYPILP